MPLYRSLGRQGIFLDEESLGAATGNALCRVPQKCRVCAAHHCKEDAAVKTVLPHLETKLVCRMLASESDFQIRNLASLFRDPQPEQLELLGIQERNVSPDLSIQCGAFYEDP